MGKEKASSFGGCAVAHIRPKSAAGPKVLNVIISFPEALKLNLALDECLRKLNKYNMATRRGKRAAVNLAVHIHSDRVAILEGKLGR